MRVEFDSSQPLDEVIRLITEARLVSFDLFDTLVESDFASRSQLFRFIEDRTQSTDFAADREFAELVQAAISPDYPGNWTLEDIYRDVRIDPELERSVLAASLRPSPIGTRLYNAARAAGVPVSVAVDGPITEDEIEAILQEHGFSEVQSIFASCGTQCSKQKYTTFRRMLDSKKLKPDQIVHIGSDPYCDLGVPADIGMHAVLLLPMKEALGQNNIRFEAISAVLASSHVPEANLLLRTLQRVLFDIQIARREGSPELADPTVELAALIGGPLVVGFSNWTQSWLAASESDVCVVVGNLDLPFVQQFKSLMAERAPDTELVLTDHEGIGSDPVRIRDLDAHRCALVNLDPDGRGAGMLVARNPMLATRPALHFSLNADARRSRQDHCFLSRYGLPPDLTAAITKLDVEGFLFNGSDEVARSTALGLDCFISHWGRIERSYPRVRLMRSFATAIVQAAAGPASA